jgi:hypothetical protein
MMRPILRDLAAGIRRSAAVRWSSVRELRQQTRAALAARRARRRQRVATRTRLAPRDDAGAWLEHAVLRAVLDHPEGVSAVEIGNAVGVDWRRVPAILGRLVERSAVDVIGDRFYPVPKASGR